jgi:hypothetical protein
MFLATLVDGKTDLADVLMLIAFILFVVVAVLRWIAHNIDGMLVAVGLACLSLAWFVL